MGEKSEKFKVRLSPSEIQSRINGGYIDYLTTYDPEYFWEEFGKVYHQTFYDAKESGDKSNPPNLNVKYILSRIGFLKPKTILEVGCGFGRVLGYLALAQKELGFEKIVGIDFSSTMIENSKKFFASQEEFKDKQIPETFQADAANLPFPDKSFDLVYTHVCLTHIPPGKVIKVRQEISRVSKQSIVHIERYAYPYEHPDAHRWTHDHIPAYLDMGWILYESAKIRKEHETIMNVFLSKE